jgi:hypothetical protein
VKKRPIIGARGPEVLLVERRERVDGIAAGAITCERDERRIVSGGVALEASATVMNDSVEHGFG